MREKCLICGNYMEFMYDKEDIQVLNCKFGYICQNCKDKIKKQNQQPTSNIQKGDDKRD